MSNEEKVLHISSKVDTIQGKTKRKHWQELRKQEFVKELEEVSDDLKELSEDFGEMQQSLSLLVESNSPDLNGFLRKFQKNLEVIKSNVELEKKTFGKEKIYDSDRVEVPELYSSLQNRAMAMLLDAQYATEALKNFYKIRSIHPTKKGATAKNLLENLQQKESEIRDLREKAHDLKRKSLIGLAEESSTAEIEKELITSDKILNANLIQAKNALKLEVESLGRVESSFAEMSTRLMQLEEQYGKFSKNALELIKDLKQERDFARKIALEVESETLKLRAEYMDKLIQLEEKKEDARDKARKDGDERVEAVKAQLEEKERLIRLLQGKLEGKHYRQLHNRNQEEE